MTLRVMTYNIRGGWGTDGARSIRRIADVVGAAGSDIVCLQEVHRRLPWSGFVDQPRVLERLLGVPAVFQPCFRFLFGGFGLAIVSRLPIRRVTRHLLPSAREQRGALEVEIETPSGPVRVICTHWGLSAEERLEQSCALSAVVRESPGPVVLCGDLNGRPEEESVIRLIADAELRDCGSASNAMTYASDTPKARIDYILVSRHFAPSDVRVLETRASDHLPLLADMTLLGSTPTTS